MRSYLSDPGWLRRCAAGLSLGATVVHGLATPEHLAEWWGYGVFFIVAAMAQGFLAVLLVIEPWRYDVRGTRLSPARAAAAARPLYRLGIVGNSAIVLLYVITRTVGIPLLGPEAGRVEPVSAFDASSVVLELGLIFCLQQLIRLLPAQADPNWRMPAAG